MAKVKKPVTAKTVTRQNKIWRATFKIEDYHLIQEKWYGEGNSAAGPRMKEILDILDQRGLNWPWTHSLTPSGEDFDIDYMTSHENVMGMQKLIITKAELTVAAYQAASKYLNTSSNVVAQYAKNEMKGNAINQLGKYNLQWENLPTNRDWSIWGIATMVDGNVINVSIDGQGSKIAAYPAFSTGSSVNIQLVGVNTADTTTNRDGNAGINATISRQYKISASQTMALGEEGKQATKDIVNIGNGFVIIDVDLKDNKPKAKGSTYLGMAYKSLYDTSFTADPMGPEDQYININKTLISSASSLQWTDSKGRSRAIPIAIVQETYVDDLNSTGQNTKFDTVVWEQTVSLDSQLSILDIAQDEADKKELVRKQVQEELDRMKDGNGQTVRTTEPYIIQGGETIQGIIKDYKSRGITVTETLLVSANNLLKDADGNYILPKGQTLIIPIIKEADIVTATTFKQTNGDVIDNTTDFFTPVDDRRDMTTKYHVRIGDIQFVVPPLSFELNQASSIVKIKTLRTKSSMMTKAGSTHSTITMQLYFHDLESMNGYQVHVGEGIEDYYMDGLRPLIAQFKKAPFVPIINEYVNEVLGIHEVCLVNLTVSTVPGFPHSLAANLTLAKFDPEAYMPQVEFLDNQINWPMFRWYYQQQMTEANAQNPYRTYLAPIVGKLTNDFHFKIVSEEDLIARNQAAKDLRFLNSPVVFDDQTAQGKNLLGRMKRDGDRATTAIQQHQRYVDLKFAMGKKFPKRFGTKDDVYKQIYGENFKISTSDAVFIPREWNGDVTGEVDPNAKGYFLIKVEAETNLAKIPLSYKSVVYAPKFEFDENTLSYLESIAKSGRDADKGIKAYKYNYNQLKERAEETEGQLSMEDYFIDDLWITAMNVSYENNFSMVQTQTGEQPTYQYLGSQDPYVQITFETTSRDSIISLQNLISKSDEYSRKYRYGITSGFIGFENQLTKLFGITTVMIENCTTRTVPGFPNRFQIDMVLCGFNKTQKRTESLDGFAAASSTDKSNRNVKTDPTQADAIIIETKLRDLELYPDLELPTYKELNAALPYIGAGIAMYHNASGSKYVDPDFYVSVNWTSRAYMKQFKDKSNKDASMGVMQLQDFAGVVGTTRVNSDNYFEPTDASKELMKSMEEKAKGYALTDPQITAGDSGQSFIGPPAPSNVSVSTPGSDTNVSGWLSNTNNIFKRPETSTVLSWMGNGGSEMEQIGNYSKVDSYLSNPSHADVYAEIYRQIDSLWLANGYVYDERTSKTNLDYITYADPDDLAKASYMWLKYSGDSRFASAPAKEDGKSITYAQLNATGGKITRERMANYIKAKLDLENGWKQFNVQGKPDKNSGSTAVGIGQIMLSIHAKTVEEAQRMSWDWRYNVQWAINYLFDKFQKAWNSTDARVRSRPWDWALRWYNLPAVGIDYLTSPDPRYSYDDGKYVPLVLERLKNNYNAPEKKFNTPGHPMNQEIQTLLLGTKAGSITSFYPTKEGVVQALKDFANRRNDTSKKNSDANIDKMTAGMTLEQVLAYYEKQIGISYNITPGDTTVRYLDRDNKVLQDAQMYMYVKHAKKVNNLVSTENPNELFRDMFTDMIEYDQRGRLLRAFPTFQMFIIDEGRWMASYKLWDNLYGFNAIQSIDVHKSRKIAADTAVIKMTNMYSNLTNRRIDEDYGDWSYSFWDNLVFGNPTQQLLNARKELVSSMMLQTGARIHLRMGYGSDATSLPIMFNGTITELDTDDVVTIVAQGDGIELTNIISADPNETNDGFFQKILEPRDLLAKLMTSKGNWFKDVISNVSEGQLFKDHPLGIMHFGNPVKTPKANAELGAVFNWYADDSDFGESVQNIYSSNGANTFSQWRYQDGTPIGGDFAWLNFFRMDWGKGTGDEADVKMKLYGQTTWDIAQTLAYVSPDYITAVHPFEFRSTLFFGKPYYKMAYRYDSIYEWNTNDSMWNRTVTSEYRKPYQQFHIFTSDTDILSNRIKASEEGVYTNVIAMVDGQPSMMQSADEDIRFDKQKTKVVQTSLVANWPGLQFWTSDKQGEYFAQSTLRDSLKDMYKGTLTVLGDPTVKPHDMCYVADILHDMNGPCLVKDVTHSFSMETGFITMISPDAIVVVDDQGTISQATWFTSVAAGYLSYTLGKKAAARSIRKLVNSASMLRNAASWSGNAAGKGLLKLATALPHDSNDVDYKAFKQALKNYSEANVTEVKQKHLKEMEDAIHKIESKLGGVNAETTAKKLGNVSRKGLLSLSKGIVNNLKTGKNALALIRIGGVASGIATFGISTLATVAISIFTETMMESYRRHKKARQAVMIIPLRYQGRNFMAGLNGVAGAVVGTKPGKMDQFYMGAGYGGEEGWTQLLGKTLNFVADGDGLLGNIIDWAAGGDPFKGSVDYLINSGDPSASKNLEKIDNAWNDSH